MMQLPAPGCLLPSAESLLQASDGGLHVLAHRHLRTRVSSCPTCDRIVDHQTMTQIEAGVYFAGRESVTNGGKGSTKV